MPEERDTSGTGDAVSVAVVYDSGSRGHPAVSGRTRVLAEAVARGAEALEGTAVRLIPVAEREDHWEALDEADAIVFGCPTYMGRGRQNSRRSWRRRSSPGSWSSGGRTSWPRGSRTRRA